MVEFGDAKKRIDDIVDTLHTQAMKDVEAIQLEYQQRMDGIEQDAVRARQILEEETAAKRTLLLDELDSLRTDKARVERELAVITSLVEAWKDKLKGVLG
jgi:hypothetical protein